MDIVIKIYQVIAKSIYKSLKSFLLFTLFMRMTFRLEFNKSILLSCTYIIIAILYGANTIYENRIKDTKVNSVYKTSLGYKKSFVISSLVLSIALSIISSYGVSRVICLFSFLYFVYVNYICIYRTKRTRQITELYETFLISVLILAMRFGNDQITLGNTYTELSVMLFLFCLFYLIINNLCYQYEKNISINKKKNIIKINTIFIFLLIAVAFLKDIAVDLLYKGFRAAEPYVTEALIAFTKFLNDTFGNISYDISKAFRGMSEMPKNGSMTSLQKVIKKSQKMQQSNVAKLINRKGVNINFNIIYSVVFISLILIIVVVISLKIHEMRKKRLVNKGFEKKEFMFSKKDILNIIKNNINKAFKGKENLSEVRLKYKTTVEDLISTGHDFYTYYTPNEFNRSVENVTCEDINLSKLTDEYNQVRYWKENKKHR